MNHPYTAGAVTGVVGGVTAYGIATVITQAQTGINLGKLSDLPIDSRVDTIAQKGFDAIQRATGLTKVEAIKNIQSSGMSLVEKRIQNLGNINNITKVTEKIIRITTTPNASKIISAGIINASKISNYMSSGAMQKVPLVTSIAKTLTKFITNLW